MSKERYTIRTEDSRIVIHWEGTADERAAIPTSIGRFVSDARAVPELHVPDVDKDAKRP